LDFFPATQHHQGGKGLRPGNNRQKPNIQIAFLMKTNLSITAKTETEAKKIPGTFNGVAYSGEASRKLFFLPLMSSSWGAAVFL
jgi:hypothetical protein